MPKIIVEEPFRFSEDTTTVRSFEPGEHEVSALCAKYAEKHHGAEIVGEKKPARKPAPKKDAK
jgi:hypothetical protein